MATDLGLLGFDDPKTLGLLSLGLRLMSTPGKFGTALGQSGLGALGDMQAANAQQEDRKRRALQDQMLQMQLEQQRKQQERAAAVEAAYRQAFRSPAQQALAGGGGPTVANAAKLPGLQPSIDQGALIQGLMQADPASAAKMLEGKPDDYKVVGGSLVKIGRGGVSEAYRAPAKPDELDGVLRAAGIMPGTPQYVQAYADRAKKLTTQPPGVQVSYGAPLPAINPKTGETELARPDNKGGIQFTGVKPPAQNRDVKVPAEIQRMNIAADTMGKLLNDYEALLDKHNPRDPMVQASPAVRAEFQSLMKGLQLQFKEVQALGALAGPDLALMEAAITDPFTMRGAYYGKDGLRGQIKQARRLLSLRKQASADATGGAGSTPDNDPLGMRK